METEMLSRLFETHKEIQLYGRYITLDHITPLLKNIASKVEIVELGQSENDAPIHLLKIGNGKKRLLLWSQMHGNESTTTKAVFDFVNMLLDDDKIAPIIKSSCTLYVIPMLNPDGSKAYTRINYNKIDLNRDAQKLSQRESRILHNLIKEIQPDFAFNLHGQRTIFSAGNVNKSATVSFLSPAGDLERSVTNSRKHSMEVIVAMNKVLQDYIPGQVGRYDDGFNINCVGDTLESMSVPTVLFEAGHYTRDYDREKTREFIFYALLTAVHYIANKEISGMNYEAYFEIPQNEKLFYDVIIRDTLLKEKLVDIAIQYSEKLGNNGVKFSPKVVKIDNLKNFYGHKEINAEKRAIRHSNVLVEVVPEVEMLKFYLNDEVFSIENVKS